jgi:hypothetical protein
MVKDILGNVTEKSVVEFLEKLDKKGKIGPNPISGVEFSGSSIIDELDCDPSIAMNLFSQPTEFMYDEMDQVFVEVLNPNTNIIEKLYLFSDNKLPGFELMCEEIVNCLPEVTFDLECGGYASRQSEAASLYKIAVVNKLQEDQYSDEIDKILLEYDFSRMSSKYGVFEFTQLLQKVQEESDSISRIVLMCCTAKLVSERVKKDTSYKGILKEADAEKLKLLAEKDASINYKFNKLYEKASTAKEKIEIGELLAVERQEMLNQSFVTPEIVLLFSIYNLNQNAVPGRSKRKIRNSASEYVSELMTEGKIKDEISALEFKKKLISRAQKQFLSRMKTIRYKLWSDKKFDNILPKF